LNQALRRAATSGRSCSLACAVFDGHRVAIQEAPHRAGRKRGAMFTAQHLCQLDQRYVHLGLDRSQDDVTICFDAM
jgi:hypothetical protein